MIDFDDVAYEDRVSSDTTDYPDGVEDANYIVTGCDDEYDDDDEGNWVDSPTDSDEYIMNEDDSVDAGDVYDIEYDR